MKKRTRLVALVALLMAVALVLGSCAADAAVTGKKKKNTPTPAVTAAPQMTAAPEVTEEPGPIIEPQRIADYLFEHGELPENFITKQEAKDLGWDSSWNYVSDVAPGMSIGGDYFGNYEGKLPKIKGRKYYECDCWYTGGKRSAYRIIYSNDGHVWYTEDHYNTFTEMSPSEKSASEKSVSGP
jgi:guanyl-specific ribonuclease Sa